MWNWNPGCEQAFTKVKKLITSDMVLTHYDPKRPLRLACDASPVEVGAVLSHIIEDGTERPIAFASRTLTAIFNPRKGIPAMTVARLQRYAPILVGFKYSIEYKSTTRHGNADGLSRLLVQVT